MRWRGQDASDEQTPEDGEPKEESQDCSLMLLGSDGLREVYGIPRQFALFCEDLVR